MAAVDAHIDAEQPSVGEEILGPTRPSGKRKNNKNSQPLKGKNKKPRVQKDSILQMMNTALMSYLPVYTSDLGAIPLCSLVYESLISANADLQLTLPCLTYVTLLAFRNRMNTVARFAGAISNMPDQTWLNAAIGSIRLPQFLADYIDAVGEVTLPSSLQVIPMTPLPQEYNQLPGYANIDLLFQQAGRDVPDNPWRIDSDWISEYVRTITVSMSTSNLTTVKKEREGDPRMLSSYAVNPRGFYETYSCVHSTLRETHLGALFMYRDFDAVGEWPGEFPFLVIPAFAGSNIRYTEWLSPMIAKTIPTIGDLLVQRLNL